MAHSTPAERLACYKAQQDACGIPWHQFARGHITERTLWQGDGVWTSETPYFRDTAKQKNGWYGDSEYQENLHIGVVARLPHSRFIAGYYVDNSETYVWFDEVWSNRRDAAYCADEHARVAAEIEDEYQQKCNEAMRLDSLIEKKLADVLDIAEEMRFLAQLECPYARNKRPKLRSEASDIITDIRALRTERAALNVEV